MVSSFHTKIVILESLPSGDRRTGTETAADLQFHRFNQAVNVPIELVKVGNRDELFSTLERLANEAELGESPILHLECHGLADRTGIALADGAEVEWRRLTNPLVHINVATRCNLLLSVAACYGAHGVRALADTDRAPFWAILAPRAEVYAQDLYGPYLRFYAELLSTGDGDRAIQVVEDAPSTPGIYGFMTCEQFFAIAYRRYLARFTTAQAYETAAAAIHTDLLAHGVQVDMALIKHALTAIEEPFFNEFFRRFVMIDLFPENASRFSLNYANFRTSESAASTDAAEVP
jgi:hypothetical protein